MPKALVIGLGKSGIAASRLLNLNGWQVIVSDRQSSEGVLGQRDLLAQSGIEVRLGHSFNPQDPDLQVDLVVVSPGVPWDVPALQTARSLGMDVIGEMELAWRHLQHTPWVGITGTNGKTTTTALVESIFQKAGLNAPACGNIGLAACEVALSVHSPTPLVPDWIIAEISSYQLESAATLAPKIGIWTTFTPDHLNRHYTLENYFRIKAKLVEQSEITILNGDDPYLRAQGSDRWPAALWTSTQGKAALPAHPDQGFYLEADWVMAQGQPIVPVSKLRMPGAHNLQNLLMAVGVAHLAGIQPDAIAKAVAEFPGVPHRLEQVCTWQGVTYINDSKATNYDAAEVGLTAIPGPVILIAGGEAKEGDDRAWIEAIQRNAKKVLLIGEAAPTFAQRLNAVNYTHTEIVETMDQAVIRASELAPQLSIPYVLLSPACASFDQYPNFEVRGDDFRKHCLALGSEFNASAG